MREIALDTETTGLDPKDGHRVVEIGCVEMTNQVRTGAIYHCYLNPERDMPPEAQKVHGLSAEFLRDKPLFSGEADAFLHFIGDAKLVIHNATFDMKFLNHELTLIGKPTIPSSRAIDTVQIARSKFPGSPANLDALCKRFEIDLSARTMHGALLDAELLADVYLELMGGRQSALGLDIQTTPKTKIIEQKVDYSELLKNRPAFAPTAEEQAAHEAFCKQLTEPIWDQYRQALVK